MFSTIEESLNIFKEEVENFLVKKRETWGERNTVIEKYLEIGHAKLNAMAMVLGLSEEETRTIWFDIEKKIQ